MTDKLFLIILVLNTTGIFSFIAPQIDVSIAFISTLLFMFNVFYLFARVRYTREIMQRGGFQLWVIVILIWPLLTVVYAPTFEFRNVGLQIYYVTLFTGSVVYSASNGLSAMRFLFTTSLVITLIGVVLSLIGPQYFENVARLSSAEGFTGSRAFGFYLQPNRLAIDLVLLFIGWFAFGKSKSVSLEVVAVILLLLAILVTGSRTGLIISLITIVFILGRSGFKEMTKFRNLLKIVMLIILIAGFSFVLKNITADMITGDKSKDELVIRMETMLDFRLSDNETTVEDTSVWHRRLAQLAYLSLINDAPLIGHGFGAETYFLDKGVFPRMSHSDAFSCALHYGILYPLVLSLIIFQLYRKQKKRGAVIPSSSVLNFVVVFLLLYFIAGDMLNDRTLFVVWGMFHAAVYHTHSLSVYDKAHKGHTTLQSLNACPQTCL